MYLLCQTYLFEYIKNGGFPRISFDYQREILQQYFNDIIYRDIVKRFKIRDVNLLEEVYLFLMTNVSNLIFIEL